MMRTPPGVKRAEEKEGETEKKEKKMEWEGVLVMMLRELKEESELKDLKNESEVWRYINKRRGGNERIKNNIGKEDW